MTKGLKKPVPKIPPASLPSWLPLKTVDYLGPKLALCKSSMLNSGPVVVTGIHMGNVGYYHFTLRCHAALRLTKAAHTGNREGGWIVLGRILCKLGMAVHIEHVCATRYMVEVIEDTLSCNEIRPIP